MKQQQKNLWETLVIAVSFFSVWIYFLIWLWTGRSEIQLSPGWQLLLLPALILLIVIFVRRVKRVLASLRGENEHSASSPRRSPPFNSHHKK